MEIDVTQVHIAEIEHLQFPVQTVIITQSSSGDFQTTKL
jgi:hypothetical protein